MKNLSKNPKNLQLLQDVAFEALSDFRISNGDAEKLLGGRTVHFSSGDAGDCHKVVDTNDNEITKIKWKERYQGKC